MRHGPGKYLDGTELASLVAQHGQKSLLRRIQAGSLTIAGNEATGTATVTACDINNSLLLPGGYTLNDSTSTRDAVLVRFTLTDATTITATRGKAGGAGACTLRYALLEFVPGVIKSVQYGTVALGASSSGTATITTVNTVKSAVIFLGESSTNTSTLTGQTCARVTLTDATTVTANVDNGADATTVAFVVVEFY